MLAVINNIKKSVADIIQFPYFFNGEIDFKSQRLKSAHIAPISAFGVNQSHVRIAIKIEVKS